MKTILALVSVVTAILMMQGCGEKVFTKGAYDDPNRVDLLDDKFNEADLHQMSEKIVDSVLNCEEILHAKGRPTIAVSKVTSRAEEFIDVDSLTEQIRTKLSKSRKVKFVNRSARAELDSEYDYGASGKQSKETAKKAGKQLGIDYLLTGSIATNVQQVANDKLIFYKLTMQLTETETGADDCTEEVEIRKKYRKQSTGIF
jgi:uncharacterized protein (TIGR02722 family)